MPCAVTCLVPGRLPFSTKPTTLLHMAELTPIEFEFATSEDAAAHNAWFRAKVERAMTSEGPGIPHDRVMAPMRATIERARRR